MITLSWLPSCPIPITVTVTAVVNLDFDLVTPWILPDVNDFHRRVVDSVDDCNIGACTTSREKVDDGERLIWRVKVFQDRGSGKKNRRHWGELEDEEEPRIGRSRQQEGGLYSGAISVTSNDRKWGSRFRPGMIHRLIASGCSMARGAA